MPEHPDDGMDYELTHLADEIKAAGGVLAGVAGLSYFLGIIAVNAYVDSLRVGKVECSLASAGFIAAGLPVAAALLLGVILTRTLAPVSAALLCRFTRRASVRIRRRRRTFLGRTRVPLSATLVSSLLSHWDEYTAAQWQAIREGGGAGPEVADYHAVEQAGVHARVANCRLALPCLASLVMLTASLMVSEWRLPSAAVDGGLLIGSLAIGVGICLDVAMRQYLPAYHGVREAGCPLPLREQYGAKAAGVLLVTAYGCILTAAVYGTSVYASLDVPLLCFRPFAASVLVSGDYRPADGTAGPRWLPCRVVYQGSDFVVVDLGEADDGIPPSPLHHPDAPDPVDRTDGCARVVIDAGVVQAVQPLGGG